jgi:hypothetical protein
MYFPTSYLFSGIYVIQCISLKLLIFWVAADKIFSKTLLGYAYVLFVSLICLIIMSGEPFHNKRLNLSLN